MSETTLEDALAALKPGSIAAQVRALMTAIEAQLAKGVSREEIVRTLNEGGVTVTFVNFCSILYRYRKKYGRSVVETVAQPPAPPTERYVEVEAVTTPATPEPAAKPLDKATFARAFDPETRYQTADRLMQTSRRFGHHIKREDEEQGSR